MDNISINLERDFKEAFKYYYQNNYIFFFRNIRPAIESLCKFLILDLIGDSILYEELLQGKKKFTLMTSQKKICGCILEEPEIIKIPTGKILADIFYRSYIYKNLSLVLDDNKKNFFKSLETAKNNLCNYYNKASELGSHEESSSYLDPKIQATSCYYFFKSFFDELKSKNVLKEDSINFLLNLFTDEPLKISQERLQDTFQEISQKNTQDIFAETIIQEELKDFAKEEYKQDLLLQKNADLQINTSNCEIAGKIPESLGSLKKNINGRF